MKKKAIFILGIFLLILIIGLFLFQKREHKPTNKPPEVNQNQRIDEKEEKIVSIDMLNSDNVKIEDQKKINISENIKKEIIYENILISNIQLYATQDLSYFKAAVKNNSAINFEGKVVTLSFQNKEGQEYSTMEIYIPEMTANGTNVINASTTKDISNAYSIKIKG